MVLALHQNYIETTDLQFCRFSIKWKKIWKGLSFSKVWIKK